MGCLRVDDEIAAAMTLYQTSRTRVDHNKEELETARLLFDLLITFRKLALLSTRKFWSTTDMPVIKTRNIISPKLRHVYTCEMREKKVFLT